MNETHFNIPTTPKDEIYKHMQTAWYMMVFGFSQYTKHTLVLTLSTCHTNITHTDPHLSAALSLPHTFELYQPILSITWTHTQAIEHTPFYPPYRHKHHLLSLGLIHMHTYSTAEHDYLTIGQRIAEHSRSLLRSTRSWCPVEDKMTG